jgi:probable HAF family extracellular repeat protein
MHICTSILRPLSAALILAALAVAAETQPATIKFKQIAIPGALFTTPTGINNSDVVVGYYVDAGGITHGFVLSGSTVTTIDDPNGTATFCEAISSNGSIVGEYTQADGNNHGFLYQNGVFTDIGLGVESGAFGVNDQGFIVGGFLKCGLCEQLGFIFDGSTYTTVSPKGATFVSVVGINNHGVMVINVADANTNYHSYIYNGATYTNIDAPGFTDTFGFSINNLGDVSMTVQKADGSREISDGAILSQGQYNFFSYRNHPDTLTRSYGINDRLQWVGGFETETAIGGFAAAF